MTIYLFILEDINKMAVSCIICREMRDTKIATKVRMKAKTGGGGMELFDGPTKEK
jgi:hypothetical protein